MTPPLIAPSILAADFSRLGDEIRAVEEAGADLLHIDIMDGHFVPNLTMGPALIQSIRALTRLPFDCHLMVDNPEEMIEPFAKAGADWLSVHVETCDLGELLPRIKKLGCKAGIVINPPTPIEKILPFVAMADFVLVMTVNPGFAGQGMIEACLEKIAVLNDQRTKNNLNFQIEVDGGIKVENVHLAHNAGADIIVAGSGIFGKKDYGETITALRRGLGSVCK